MRRIFCALIFAVLGCAASARPDAATVTFTTIDRGLQSNVDEPRQAIVRTSAEWAKLWTLHASEGRDRPPVDFTKATVIGVFMGSRPTGGYAIEITSIDKEASDVVVTYKETTPPPGSMLSQALTLPYHIVKIDRQTGPIKFKKSS